MMVVGGGGCGWMALDKGNAVAGYLPAVVVIAVYTAATSVTIELFRIEQLTLL
jgi:hypothetical protein